MRFELFLEQLPRAAPERIKERLAELPPGVSPGLIFKGLENKRVPTVPVAYTDDKRVMNEISDTLLELGAQFRLVDHGNLLQKLGTLLSERMGAARYLDHEDDAPIKPYKLNNSKNQSHAEAAIEHALNYLLQLVGAEVLLFWYLGLRVGFGNVDSMPGLTSLLSACGVGVLSAYGMTSSIHAMRLGRLSWLRAAPVFAASLACTLASFFFLGHGSDRSERSATTVIRPESRPYAGLLAELRNRKLAAELAGETAGDDPSDALADQAATSTDDEVLLCEQPEIDAVAECAVGPSWDEQAACLAAPRVAAAPAALQHSEQTPVPVPVPVWPAKQARAQPWQIVLDRDALLMLGGLAAFLTLVVLALERAVRGPKRRVAAQADAPDDALPSAADDTRDAISALQNELTVAREALATGQAQATELQRELGALSKERDDLQLDVQRLEQLHAQAALERKAQADRELQALARSRQLANDEAPARKLPEPIKRTDSEAPGSAREQAEESSAYSVNSGREDRVVMPKRRS